MGFTDSFLEWWTTNQTSNKTDRTTVPSAKEQAFGNTKQDGGFLLPAVVPQKKPQKSMAKKAWRRITEEQVSGKCPPPFRRNRAGIG